MLVRATKRGFDGIKLRRVGDEFSYDGEQLPSWVEPVEQQDEPTHRGRRRKQEETTETGSE